MEKYTIGIVTYTKNEDGTYTRTVDADKQAEIIAKLQQDKS